MNYAKNTHRNRLTDDHMDHVLNLACHEAKPNLSKIIARQQIHKSRDILRALDLDHSYIPGVLHAFSHLEMRVQDLKIFFNGLTNKDISDNHINIILSVLKDFSYTKTIIFEYFKYVFEQAAYESFNKKIVENESIEKIVTFLKTLCHDNDDSSSSFISAWCINLIGSISTTFGPQFNAQSFDIKDYIAKWTKNYVINKLTVLLEVALSQYESNVTYDELNAFSIFLIKTSLQYYPYCEWVTAYITINHACIIRALIMVMKDDYMQKNGQYFDSYLHILEYVIENSLKVSEIKTYLEKSILSPTSIGFCEFICYLCTQSSLISTFFIDELYSTDLDYLQIISLLPENDLALSIFNYKSYNIVKIYDGYRTLLFDKKDFAITEKINLTLDHLIELISNRLHLSSSQLDNNNMNNHEIMNNRKIDDPLYSIPLFDVIKLNETFSTRFCQDFYTLVSLTGQTLDESKIDVWYGNIIIYFVTYCYLNDYQESINSTMSTLFMAASSAQKRNSFYKIVESCFNMGVSISSLTNFSRAIPNTRINDDQSLTVICNRSLEQLKFVLDQDNNSNHSVSIQKFKIGLQSLIISIYPILCKLQISESEHFIENEQIFLSFLTVSNSFLHLVTENTDETHSFLNNLINIHDYIAYTYEDILYMEDYTKKLETYRILEEFLDQIFHYSSSITKHQIVSSLIDTSFDYYEAIQDFHKIEEKYAVLKPNCLYESNLHETIVKCLSAKKIRNLDRRNIVFKKRSEPLCSLSQSDIPLQEPHNSNQPIIHQLFRFLNESTRTLSDIDFIKIILEKIFFKSYIYPHIFGFDNGLPDPISLDEILLASVQSGQKNQIFWPPLEYYKEFGLRDGRIVKNILKYPFVWDVLLLMRTDKTRITIKQSHAYILFATMSYCMLLWENGREGLAIENGPLYKITLDLFVTLNKFRMLKHPYNHISIIMPYMLTYDVYLILTAIWKQIYQAYNDDVMIEDNNLLRTIFHKHINNIGIHYKLFF